MTAGATKLVALDDILPAPRNAKGHDIGAIIASISRFGFVAPVIIDRRTGRMVAGHGRLKALAAMRADGHPPPVGVTLGDDGRWYIEPKWWESRADAEAEAYTVADNRLVELGGIEDEDLLAEMLTALAQSGDLIGTGYDGDDVDAMLARLAADAAGDDEGESTGVSDAEAVQCPRCGERFRP